MKIGFLDFIAQDVKKNPVTCGWVGLLALAAFVIGELALINPCGCFSGIGNASLLSKIGGYYLGTSGAVTAVFLLVMNHRYQESRKELEELKKEAIQKQKLEDLEEAIKLKQDVETCIQTCVQKRPKSCSKEHAECISRFILAQCGESIWKEQDIADAQLMWGDFFEERHERCSLQTFQFFYREITDYQRL